MKEREGKKLESAANLSHYVKGSSRRCLVDCWGVRGGTVIFMIEILSANKITIDAIGDKEPFLVCEKKEDGGLLIMGLDKYLKIGLRRSKGKGTSVKRGGSPEVTNCDFQTKAIS